MTHRELVRTMPSVPIRGDVGCVQHDVSWSEDLRIRCNEPAAPVLEVAPGWEFM
ncbi:MAG: hypothetical protein O3C70_01105 [Actinomycetota bacterium]|nr:hypothetical protein [Actinomycetota bacterium]